MKTQINLYLNLMSKDNLVSGQRSNWDEKIVKQYDIRLELGMTQQQLAENWGRKNPIFLKLKTI